MGAALQMSTGFHEQAKAPSPTNTQCFRFRNSVANLSENSMSKCIIHINSKSTANRSDDEAADQGD